MWISPNEAVSPEEIARPVKFRVIFSLKPKITSYKRVSKEELIGEGGIPGSEEDISEESEVEVGERRKSERTKSCLR